LFAALPQETKIALWQEHIHRFGLGHPELSAEQSAVLGEATALVPDIFSAAAAHAHSELEQLESKAVATLGSRNAFAALAMLGPAEPTSAAEDCWCNVGSACSCPSGHECRRIGSCAGSGSGCGCFWIHDCDGDFCEDTG
jgi:hypothetical protein